MKAGLLKELTIIDLAEIRRRKCDLPWWSRSEDGFTVQRLLATLDTAYIVGGKCCAEIRELKAVIERQGNALRAVEALAAKLRREDRFAYASDIYDALERDD